MSRAVYRVVVPVDDQWHQLQLKGPILHIATRDPRVLEVWFLDDTTVPAMTRTLRVFGTGQSLPDDAGKHVGTAIAPGGGLVWHLFERTESTTTLERR